MTALESIRRTVSAKHPGPMRQKGQRNVLDAQGTCTLADNEWCCQIVLGVASIVWTRELGNTSLTEFGTVIFLGPLMSIELWTWSPCYYFYYYLIIFKRFTWALPLWTMGGQWALVNHTVDGLRDHRRDFIDHHGQNKVNLDCISNIKDIIVFFPSGSADCPLKLGGMASKMKSSHRNWSAALSNG